MRRFFNGFTLIELLVVIAVLAIIGAFGFAALVSYSRAQTLSNAARDFRSHLKLAQSKAIVQEKPSGPTQCNSSSPLIAYRLQFTNSTNYQIWALCSTTVVVGTFSLPQQVTRTVPSADTYIDFLVQTGIPRLDSGFTFPFKIRLEVFGMTQDIDITATGVIQ